MEYRISVENSAPSQAKVAKSVIWACEVIPSENIKSVCDFGCGRLRNLGVINNHFGNVVLVDTEVQCERIKNHKLPYGRNELISNTLFIEDPRKFDIIFLICVLHIIPLEEERDQILDLLWNKLNANGQLIIDVPCGENYYRKKMIPENRHNDGYLLRSGTSRTFYKNFYSYELDPFIQKGNRFRLIKKKGFEKHLVRIFTKCEEYNAFTKQS